MREWVGGWLLCSPGIPPHVDTHSAFMEEIISLSLGAQVCPLLLFSLHGSHFAFAVCVCVCVCVGGNGFPVEGGYREGCGEGACAVSKEEFANNEWRGTLSLVPWHC